MNKEINISESEWKVMELLWKNDMLTIGEIRKGLSDTSWSDSTIKTMVRRLTQKGVVGRTEGKGQFRYYSVANGNECKLKETKSLINRIYNGSVKMLMASLASDSNLTNEETERLMEIIDKMDGGNKV